MAELVFTVDSALPYAFTDVTWSGGYLHATTFGEGILAVTYSS